MATTPMVFDSQPVSAPLTVPTTSQASTPDDSGMIFDQQPVSQPTPVENPQPRPQSPPTAQPPIDQISAIPDSSLADKIKNWANNVSGDIKHGADITGIGHVLKAMGAHGVYNGNSGAVGDFMASLPLGLLRVVRGGAESLQPSQQWNAAKDMLGGTLDAATIPASFAAPEAGEAAGEGIEAGAGQVARAAKAVGKAGSKLKAPFDVKSVQPALQNGVRDVLNTVAKDEGVIPSPAQSIRDVAGQLGDSILARSKSAYATLDAATGGRVQRYADAIKNVSDKLRDSIGTISDDDETALMNRKAELEKAQEAAFAQAKANGVDPKLVDAASDDWKQANALYDLETQIRASASGMRPELATAKSSPELLDAKKAFARLNKLYDSGRLQQAVGQQNAQDLIQTADTAFLQSQKVIARRQAMAKYGVPLALGATGAGLFDAAKAGKDLLGN